MFANEKKCKNPQPKTQNNKIEDGKNLKRNSKYIKKCDQTSFYVLQKEKKIGVTSKKRNQELNISHLDNNDNNLEFSKLPNNDKQWFLENNNLRNRSIVTDNVYAEKIGFFNRLKLTLKNTRRKINFSIKKFFFKKSVDEKLFKFIADQLIMADVGLATTTDIVQRVKEEVLSKKLFDDKCINLVLKQTMSEILETVEKPLKITNKFPFIILVVGSNGVGKTTTIGKLAKRFKQEGKSVMLAAGDTFRAGAIEQLNFWSKLIKIPIITQHSGADPAAVIFDAIQSAQSKKIEVLIADTAGRLQNKSYLMEELKKIIRVMKKLDNSFPHEITLVIDASNGQNIIQQIKLFHEALGIKGLILTKLDGTAKGGIVFSIANQFKIPIRYIGIGEKIDDLDVFHSSDFIEALFSKGVRL